MKKILFPFLDKERHDFLLNKWWFRLITVIYIVALIIIPFVLWLNYMDFNAGWCYDTLQYYEYAEFSTELAECSELARSIRVPGAGFAVLTTLICHYLIQLVFFKIIINYIVLGGRK